MYVLNYVVLFVSGKHNVYGYMLIHGENYRLKRYKSLYIMHEIQTWGFLPIVRERSLYQCCII